MRRKLVGGILLVAGTAIGAAMLALPVSTGLAGFWPSLGLFFFVWFFMTHAAFLFLEVNCGVGERGCNMITLVRRTLGPIGEVIAWITYLLLLYALMAAYISGCGALLITWVEQVTGWNTPSWVGPIPFVVIFGALIHLGARPVDLLNRIMMWPLLIIFIVLIVMLAPHMQPTLLNYVYLPWLAVPLTVVVTSFGFAVILPSLMDYLDRDIKQIRRCLWWGSAIPLLVYVVWQLMVLATIPVGGKSGLMVMLEGGQPAATLTSALANLTGVGFLSQLSGVFFFLVIATSFLGVALSLSDFFADGLRMRGRSWGRSVATSLTFIPPFIFALVYPRGFIAALSYGGVFVAILMGILPVFMVWFQRYRLHVRTPCRAFGGKWMLAITALFFIWVIAAHFYEEVAMNKLLEMVGM